MDFLGMAELFFQEDEDELRRLFDRMMAESVQSRVNEQAPNSDMSIPTNVRDKIHKQIHFGWWFCNFREFCVDRQRFFSVKIYFTVKIWLEKQELG